jgi:GMP synthase-like glutamine amidotransferase
MNLPKPHSTALRRAHVLQHVPFEGLGQLDPWLGHAGFQIQHTRFFESSALPDPAAVDFLVVLGGPMSVNDEAIHPWLADEKEFLRRFLATGKPLLGICLGAQLLANALGARVHANREKEIGWFPIEGLPPPEHSRACRFPARANVFHWHGETFDLPPGAIHLARSQACENQAFQIGAAIGLQFHLETTPESARALIDHARSELVPATFVQTETEILAAPAVRYQSLHRLLDNLLAHLVPTVDLRLS